MSEKVPRRSLFRAMAMFAAIVLMVGMFTASIVCVAFAYRTWSGSVVKVYRGLGVPQKSYTHLSDEDKGRIHVFIAGAAGSALVGAGILAALRGRAAGER